MKSANLRTKIFLDSGNPADTHAALSKLGFLEGQTTNPSLVAKHPEIQKKKEAGEHLTEKEMLEFYRKIVVEISELIPQGSVSIEVYADSHTTADQMFAQGKEFFGWIPNAHIKYPTTAAGLQAAERSVAAGMRVNMILVFSQAQAAAVHAATKGAKKGDVFLSPFIGRLDDISINGMDLIANCLKMYQGAASHVDVLTASVRSLDHFLAAVNLGSDIITSPLKILQEWAEGQVQLPAADYSYQAKGLNAISFEAHDLSKPWDSFDIKHELTDKGQAKFAADWNGLIQ
jgi:transaldolase